MTAGDIYTVAGNGGTGFAGDGGKATKAHVVNPEGVSVDGSGNLVIADTGNNRIRVVADTTGTFYGQSMTAGDIYTVAGGGTGGLGDGGPATSAQLTGPWDVTVDSSGNLVITDTGDSLVRVVAETTGTFYGQSMTAGDIYTVAGDGTSGLRRRRRPGRQRRTRPAGGDGDRRRRGPADLRHRQQPDPGGGRLTRPRAAGSHEMLSIPGPEPKLRAMDFQLAGRPGEPRSPSAGVSRRQERSGQDRAKWRRPPRAELDSVAGRVRAGSAG